MTLMAERIPPPDAVDAAVHVLRQRAETPSATANGGRRESDSERRLLYITLACLAIAAVAGIAAAVFIGYQADQDREQANAVDVRALDEGRCRSAFAEAQAAAEGRHDVAEGRVDDARAAAELALLQGPISDEAAEALTSALTRTRAAAADELARYSHATEERDGAVDACAADPSIRPTPAPPS